MVRRGDRGRSMLDVIASVDAVVGKLGYRLPVEAACHGKPMLYVSRPDWSETPVVASWMDRKATARSDEHTSELQSLMRRSYDDFCLEKQRNTCTKPQHVRHSPLAYKYNKI